MMTNVRSCVCVCVERKIEQRFQRAQILSSSLIFGRNTPFFWSMDCVRLPRNVFIVYVFFLISCLQQLEVKNKTKQHYVTFVCTNTREIWYQFFHWLIPSLCMRIVYLKNGMNLYTPKLGNNTFHRALSSHQDTITPNYTFKRISHHPFPVLDVWTRRLQEGGKGQDAVGTNRNRLITFR